MAQKGESSAHPRLSVQEGGTAAPQSMWRREYDHLLAKGLDQGALSSLPDGMERRQHPRFRLRTGVMSIQVESQYPVINLSLSGISFHSLHPIKAGQRLNLVLEKAFLVEVEVVDCARSKESVDGELWPYRVHGVFVNLDHGMQLIVVLHEMDDLLLIEDQEGAL